MRRFLKQNCDPARPLIICHPERRISAREADGYQVEGPCVLRNLHRRSGEFSCNPLAGAPAPLKSPRIPHAPTTIQPLMKAIQVTHPGGPEALQLVDLPIPKPKPNEALVKVAAAGVNFVDIYQREGRYKVPLPFIAGQEGAGTVVEAVA